MISRQFTYQFYKPNTRYNSTAVDCEIRQRKSILICIVCYPSAKGIFGKGQTQLTLKIWIIFFFHMLYVKEHAEGDRQVNVFVIVLLYSRNYMVIGNICFHITVM